jgi:hypothetical protein
MVMKVQVAGPITMGRANHKAVGRTPNYGTSVLWLPCALVPKAR